MFDSIFNMSISCMGTTATKCSGVLLGPFGGADVGYTIVPGMGTLEKVLSNNCCRFSLFSLTLCIRYNRICYNTP